MNRNDYIYKPIIIEILIEAPHICNNLKYGENETNIINSPMKTWKINNPISNLFSKIA